MLGGNKSLLFNAEYLIHIAGPVRLVLFYDAGQVRDSGEKFGWKEPVIQRTVQGQLVADDILDPYYIFNPLTFTPTVTTQQVGEAQRVQDLDRRRDPVLHAGAERAVPADLRDEPARAAACSTTTCSPRRSTSSGSRWGRRSDDVASDQFRFQLLSATSAAVDTGNWELVTGS